MVKPAWFIGFLAFLLVVASSLSDVVPDGDPFSAGEGAMRIDLEKFSGAVVAKLKLNHARSRGRYDIGVLGNSRSLDIAKSDLGFDGCSYFNFSIGSESLRSSVALLESLSEGGALPRTAIISVDHFELQRYNNPLFLPLFQRWTLAARDLWAGLTDNGIAIPEFLKMGWRHLRNELFLFKQNFSIELFLTNVKLKLGFPLEPAGGNRNGISYRSDGSHVSPPLAKDYRLSGLLVPISPQILFGYLKYDLARLKKLQKSGVDIILYETRIEPKSARFFARNPSPYAAATRSRFLALCREFSFRCYPAPTDMPLSDLPWANHSHPPGKSSGVYLTRLLAKDIKECGRDL